MSQPTRDDWQAIGEALRKPFAPQDVEWRVQGKPSEQGKVQMVAYVDARAIGSRLDGAVGPGGWAFTWEVIAQDDKGEIALARGTLAIYGVVKQDVGSASGFSPSKGCVSDALKRAAVLWGIGRYLYDLPSPWMQNVGSAKFPKISSEDRRRLLALLPRSGEAAPARTEARIVDGALEDVDEAPRHAQGSTAAAGGTDIGELVRIINEEFHMKPAEAIKLMAVKDLRGLQADAMRATLTKAIAAQKA